jgi:hypothetical protein
MTKVKLVNLPEIPLSYVKLITSHMIKLFTVLNLEKLMLVHFKNILCDKNVLFHFISRDEKSHDYWVYYLLLPIYSFFRRVVLINLSEVICII